MGMTKEETPERVRAFELMSQTTAWVYPHNGQPRYDFGNPAASDRAKNFLRSLLRQNAGHPDAEAVRALFNEFRADGVVITRVNVSAAIEVLKGI